MGSKSIIIQALASISYLHMTWDFGSFSQHPPLFCLFWLSIIRGIGGEVLCSWDFVLGGSKEGKGWCLILYHISMNFAGCEFCVGGFDHCYTRILGGGYPRREG